MTMAHYKQLKKTKTKPKEPTTLQSAAPPAYVTDGRMPTYGSSAGMNCHINGEWTFAI